MGMKMMEATWEATWKLMGGGRLHWEADGKLLASQWEAGGKLVGS